MKLKTPENRFGSELERLRELLTVRSGEKWSQKRVAEAVGVSTPAYQNWIHGRRGKNIDVVTIKKLADVLSADFRNLVRLARPDVFMLVQTLSKDEGNSSEKRGNIHKKVDYPPDVVYISSILNILYTDDKKEFDKVKRIILDFYPTAVDKIKKRIKKQK